MARKVTEPMAAVVSSADSTAQPTLEAPPPAPPKRGPGRPPKTQATITPISPPPAVVDPLTPQDMLPMTTLLLKTLARGIKGDAPTADEIELVNSPATKVANKYNILSRWAPELALLGALMIAMHGMRERAAIRLAELQAENARQTMPGGFTSTVA